MKYTIDQQEALDSMLEWSKLPLTTEDSLFYTVNGAAGTGKTTITKAFINSLKMARSKIAVTAPTHKAKKQIQNATDFNGQTIQKLLGLRPDVNIDKFDINNPTFNPIGEDQFQFFKVILIDESSMLNKDAYDLICKKAVSYKTRVVFLGDEYQLPPIGEKISKVFTAVKNVSTLTTIVRQGDDNPMSPILKMLRADIKYDTSNGIETLIAKQEEVLNDKGFRCLHKTLSEDVSTTFGAALLPYYYSTEYTHNINHMKFIAYTNDSVELWSDALRGEILKEKAKNILNVGESLLGYKSIIADRHNTLIIENSEDYFITYIEDAVSDFGIKGFRVTLTNTKDLDRTVFVVNHKDKENFEKFRTVCINKLDIAKAKRGGYWRQFFLFKNQHLLLVDVARNPNISIKTYGNLLCKKELYYNYGVTVHKSQGSSYENVAVNLIDLYKNYNTSERARLIYVALSRTKNINLILVK